MYRCPGGRVYTVSTRAPNARNTGGADGGIKCEADDAEDDA